MPELFPVAVSGKTRKPRLRGDALLDAQGEIITRLMAHTDLRRDGGPALAAAAEREQWGLAGDLLKHHADVNARDRRGSTVLMITVGQISLGRDSVSPDILNAENVPSGERKQRRAEAAADDREALAFLRELLRHHPNLHTTRREDGATALALARQSRLADVVALLRRAGARR